ncbi:MAG: hypothetical protein QNK30_10160 [Bacteroidales bacterium]|nr:hypothetical protein [Bacteroidales bacterium]
MYQSQYLNLMPDNPNKISQFWQGADRKEITRWVILERSQVAGEVS